QTLTLQWPASLQLLGPGGADALIAFNLSVGLSDAQSTTDATLPSWVNAVSCTNSWAFSAVASDAAGSVPASATLESSPAPPHSPDSPGVVSIPKSPKTKHPTTGTKGTGVCAHVTVGVQCGPGNGRRTSGGGSKVSHKGWPAVTGALMIADDHGRKIVGSPFNDELLGANRSDPVLPPH